MTTPKLAVPLAAALALALPAAGASGASTIALKAERVDALSATVLAAPNGRTLYRLKPETARHLLCTSKTCLGAWHPLTVRSKTATVRLPSGYKGHAHLLRRGASYQVMIGSEPLYTFVGDSAAGQAAGDGISSFGGTWHTLTVAADAAAPAQPAPSPYPY